MVYEIYGAENNVIVDVSFVNVRREYIFMLPLCYQMCIRDSFNIDHPKDFKGHSLSVSDVVVLHQDGPVSYTHLLTS